MIRRPEDVTLSTTAFGVILATSAIVTLVVYAVLTALHLIPASLLTQTAAQLVH